MSNPDQQLKQERVIQETEVPKILNVTVSRLHNTGDYEHTRYEVCVDARAVAQPGQLLLDLSQALDALDPKPPVDEWNLGRARDALAKPEDEWSMYERQQADTYRLRVAEYERWQKNRRDAIAFLDAMGAEVSRKHTDAKLSWDDEDN